MPEAVEGNAERDWELWEDSVTALDSQMQPLLASGYGRLASRASGFDKLPPSSEFDEVDAFSSVRKRDR